MGIQVDWEIEAERQTVPAAGKDDADARKRRRAQRRFIGVMLLFLLIIGGLIGAVALRLRTVEWEIEQALRATVASEVAALRLGDRELFMSLQRSAAPDWIQRQEAAFDRYQSLKQSQDINLTGRILESVIDGQRARILLEEVINGVPYGRVWTYWRYDDGWRHTLTDYTFWGEPAAIDMDNVDVNYHTLDEATAAAVAETVDRWLETGCAIFACDTQLSIDIVPSESLTIEWLDEQANTLRIPTPYSGDARLDQPFDPVTQLEAANLIARQLVDEATNGQAFDPNSEAEFLRRSAVSWLVGRFLNVSSGSFLLDSLARNYGDEAVGTLIRSLIPETTASALASLTNTTLDQADLDWRDYLTWRLSLEGLPYQVISIERVTDLNGLPALRASVQNTADPSLQGAIDFSLVDGVWQRSG
jgi:hypothetical protein